MLAVVRQNSICSGQENFETLGSKFRNKTRFASSPPKTNIKKKEEKYDKASSSRCHDKILTGQPYIYDLNQHQNNSLKMVVIPMSSDPIIYMAIYKSIDIAWKWVIMAGAGGETLAGMMLG